MDQNQPNKEVVLTTEHVTALKKLIFAEVKSERNISVQTAIFNEFEWIFKNIKEKYNI